MSSCDVRSALERSGKSVFVECRTVARRRIDHAESIESRAVLAPPVQRVTTPPLQLLTPIEMMAAPESSIALVETDDVLHSFEGTPRRPRCSLAEFVTQRRSIESVGGHEVREEATAIEHRARSFGQRTDQHVIVQMRFTVSIHAVRESHDARPSSRVVAVLAATPVAHDQRVLLEIVKSRGHRRAVCRDYARPVFGIDRQQNGRGSRSGDDDVVAEDRRSLRCAQHLADGARIAGVAASSEPPTGFSVA